MKTIFINSSLEISSRVKDCLNEEGLKLVKLEQASKLSVVSVSDYSVTHIAILFDRKQLDVYRTISLKLASRPELRVLILYYFQDYDFVSTVYPRRPNLLFHEMPKTVHALANLLLKSAKKNAQSDEKVLEQKGLCFEKGRAMIGDSRAISEVYLSIFKLARVETSVLLTGESGTGKELVARALHYNSKRQKGPFVAVNCAALADSLIESELFGHDKGAYTGASCKKIGKFQFAEGGTLFLDEIGDISPSLQVKLLRVLQEKSFTPVGSNIEEKTNIRIVAATNRSLEKMVKDGTFRADLFYRLNILPLKLPPLRDRSDDIELLVHFFIDKFRDKHELFIRGIDQPALEALKRYSWPGNVRELENVIEHAFIVEPGDTIHLNSLPPHFNTLISMPSSESEPLSLLPYEWRMASLDTGSGVEQKTNQDLNYQASKERFEREFLVRAMQAFNGRINKTAANTKMTKVTLLRKLDKYQIDPRKYHPTR